MSSKEIITFVIICLSIFLLSCGVVTMIILLSIREKKYKDFLIANSEKIHLLQKLNEKYVFKKVAKEYEFYHRFDNKGWWYKTEPIDFATRTIRNDLDKWFVIKEAIDFNRAKLKEYDKEIKAITITILESLCLANKKKYKKCKKKEQKIFDSLIQRPTTDLVINVRLRYVSPKGKVDESKSASFRYVELSRILDSVSMKRVDKATYERLALAERAMISDSLRYDIMKRDGFKCVLCGMSAKDGAILHVDHIIPVSKGGKSEKDNLRTLCERCNLGKSNKIE